MPTAPIRPASTTESGVIPRKGDVCSADDSRASRRPPPTHQPDEGLDPARAKKHCRSLPAHRRRSTKRLVLPLLVYAVTSPVAARPGALAPPTGRLLPVSGDP